MTIWWSLQEKKLLRRDRTTSKFNQSCGQNKKKLQGKEWVPWRSINTAGDELKLRAVRMSSRSMKRKTCIHCHVSKFSSDVCVRGSVYVCLLLCVHWSLFSALAKSLFPAKSKVGGGCISASLHNRERWGGGGGGGSGGGIFATRQEGSEMYSHTRVFTHTVWHLVKPQCVSTNLFPQENRSTS